MNTAPDPDSHRQQRRKGTLKSRTIPKPRGTYLPVIENDEMAAELGRIISLFAQVEYDMTVVLHFLLGNPAHAAGAAIQRTLRAPRTRLDVMLELAKEQDVLLEGAMSARQLVELFEGVNSKRNSYVHGLWWTRMSPDPVQNFLAPIGEYFPAARLVEVDELRVFFRDLNTLWFQLKGFKSMTGDSRFRSEFP